VASKQVFQFEDLPPGPTFMGADPDSHNISVVRLRRFDTPQIVLFKVPGKIRALQCVPELARVLLANDMIAPGPKLSGLAAVEAMDISYTGKTNQARKQNVVDLAPMSGALAVITEALCNLNTVLVLPGAWKGQVPKDIHQARICAAMGWKFEKSGTSVWPIDAEYTCTKVSAKGMKTPHVLGKGEWKHVLDSVGLALFAAKRYKREEK